jgi:CBS domain-containing protein
MTLSLEEEANMDIGAWLGTTRASDLMVRSVVTLKPADTLAHAAAVMLHEQISGAPVIDREGVCVGVLSASGILGAEDKVAQEQRKVAESSFWNSNLALPMSVYADKLEEVREKIAPAAGQPVERFMTSDLVSVTADTPLRVVVESMVNAHVHRVVVLDADRRLRGIISTTDVLAALLRSV